VRWPRQMPLTEEYIMTGKTGSFRYMAPEVFLDDPRYNEAVDIYSAGMLMWFMVTGLPPLAGIPPSAAASAAALTMARPDLVIINKKHSLLIAVLMERCWNQVGGLFTSLRQRRPRRCTEGVCDRSGAR
jgi:serine/threonine protein kinase